MAKKEREEAYNCLKNEKVIVRFLKKQRGSVQDPNSPLFGGMADTSSYTIVVPRDSSGTIKNILDENEKSFIEKKLGLEEDSLSVYKRDNNYWCTSTTGCINKVVLSKRGLILDLNNVEDYIKYKILLANPNLVCPSLEDLEDRPKNTYLFVLVNQAAETKAVGDKANLKYKCFMLYHKYKDNMSVLRCIVELMEGKKVSSETKLEYLQSMVTNLIETDKKRFKEIADDEYLEYKALIKEGTEKGIISMRNGLYYFKEDSSPLCNDYEEPRLSVAAKYLASPANQELKDKIEYLIKN